MDATEGSNAPWTLAVKSDGNQQHNASREAMATHDRATCHQDILFELTTSSAYAQGELSAFTALLTRSVATSLSVDQASVWLLSEEGASLTSIGRYDLASGTCDTEKSPDAAVFHARFEMLSEAPAVAPTDNSGRPASSLSVPILAGGSKCGMLCMERSPGGPPWHPEEVRFARQLASLFGAAIANRDRARDLENLRSSHGALRDAHDMLSSIVRDIPDIIYRLDPDGRVVFVNEAVSKYGYSPSDMIGQDIFAFVHPEDREAAQFRLNERRTGNRKTSSFEVRLLPQTLAERQFEVKSRATETDPVFLLDAEGLYSAGQARHGDFVGTQGVARDITERKKFEEALQQGKVLMEAAGRLARVGGYSAKLPTGELIWSDELCRIHGYKPGFTPGRETAGKHVAPEWREYVSTAFQTCIQNASQLDETFEIVTVDGERRWVRSNAEIVQDESGRAVQILGAVQDITDQVRAREQHDSLQAQLAHAQRLESVGRLAGAVAHDYNNMLQVIVGYTEMALSSSDLSPAIREDIMEVRNAAERSMGITRQLLAFARKEATAPEVLDLNDTVSTMVAMLHRLIGENVSLSWLPGTALDPVEVDPVHVDQVLVNLCVNARDAIDGAGSITISTENVDLNDAFCAGRPGYSPGRYVSLAVQDDGCGMTPEMVAYIFEPFFTTKSPDKGTGLGLATVHGIVRQNNGLIDVQSHPGQGTCFSIYFPSAPEPVASPRRRRATSVPAAGGSATILLVEDEHAIRVVAAKMLTRLGHTVLSASTPAESLDLTESHEGKIQLLITDIVLPEMNGVDLAEMLLAKNPDLQTIFMSGYTAEAIADHQATFQEPVTFLQKPFSLHDLAAKVAEVLAS